MAPSDVQRAAVEKVRAPLAAAVTEELNGRGNRGFEASFFDKILLALWVISYSALVRGFETLRRFESKTAQAPRP